MHEGGANFGTILLVLAAIFFGWLKQRGRAPARARPPEAGAEAAERTRRVQEAVRRKIAERREAPPVPPIDPFGGPPQRSWAADQAAGRDEPPAPPARASEDPAPPPVKFLPPPVKIAPAALGATAAAPHWLAEQLRDPASVRRAVILREVLGPPAGLR